MDVEVSAKLATILAMVEAFMEAEVIPLEGELLHGDPTSFGPAVRRAQAKVRQVELWSPNHPVDYGGQGLSMVEHGLLSEALGRSPLGHHVFGAQASDAVDTAIQVHGALGVTDDTTLSYWCRHERAARIYDGSDEVHKSTLGRRSLARHRERHVLLADRTRTRP